MITSRKPHRISIHDKFNWNCDRSAGRGCALRKCETRSASADTVRVNCKD